MSVSRHSAELGFTLIKEGLPKSAGSSLAPLQPRAERASERGSLPPRHPLRSLFLTPRQHAAHVRPIQKRKEKEKKKHSHLPFLLSVSVPLLSILPLSTGGGREREEEGKKNAPKHR